MRIHARAESLSLEAEEHGWVLLAETEDGDSIELRIHGVAYEFAGSEGLRSLLEWRAEGEEVRQHAEQTTWPYGWPTISEGYGERMREGTDLARKAERENR